VRSALILLLVATASCGLEVPPNVDRDNDNHRDAEDNCPNAANPDQSDFDRDGAGDACDECVDGGADDLDADGIPDGCDGCVSNGIDDDGDGIPENCDGGLGGGEAAEGDGMDDACDACVGTGKDIDSDQIDDACDECINTFLDMDADGIDDGCDPCIASGVDGDQDGVDDHCDPCLAGPQHDEDGDTLFDACDNCPAVPNLDQANNLELLLVSDVLGDACDDDASVNSETFDPFTSTNPAWYVQGANWLPDNDTMRFLGGAESYRLLGTASTRFTLRTKVELAGPSIGLQTRWVSLFASIGTLQPAAQRLECYVDMDTGQLSLRSYGAATEIANGSSTVDLSKPFELVLSVDESAKEATCGSDLTKGASLTPQNGGPWNPGIAASRASVRFYYYDVVTR